MVRLSGILKDYRESGALNSLLNVHAAIGEHTFLTKSGDLFSVLKAKGVDYEGRDTAQLDHEARRFEAAARVFDESYRIYQYFIKRGSAPIPYRTYPDNPVVQQAVVNRIEFLNAKADTLYSAESYFVVVYECGQGARNLVSRSVSLLTNPVGVLRERFSTQARITAFDEGLRQAQERLAHKVNSFIVQLQDSIQPSLLGKDEAFRFIRRLLNFSPHKCNVGLKFDRFVDYQACGSMLECHRDHLRLDDHYVQVLTLKEPPSRTFAHILRGLQELSSNCVIASEWKRESNAHMRKIIQSKRRHFHNSKASMLNYLNNSQTASQDVLIDDSASALVRDLGGCLEELEVRGNHFGQFSMSVVLHDEDPSRLKRAAAECVKIFAAYDAQLIEERYNLLNAFLAVIPGNHLYNLRRMWLLNTNYADLSLLFTVHAGEAVNDHLQAEYLAVLETNHGTPYFFNLHCQDVAHSLILGATGSGKSFLLNFLITNIQKYQPRTFIFDLGRGYENLARLFKGSYLAVASEKRAFTINPFVLAPTTENLRFLFSFVRVLIESNGYAMTTAEEKDLFEQIETMYAVEPPQRRLYTLANVLGRTLRAQLQRWVQGGPFGTLFDNAEDTLTLSPFQVFDFEGMDKTPSVLEALLFYILHRANASILDEALGTTFKVFVMDEAWRFMRHPTIKLYITEALKTWRKKNAAMLLATQSTDDLLQSDMLEVVVESCPTKIFLANPGMNRETYRKVFHLTETEAELIAGLIPKQQLLVKRPDRTKVLNLHVDRKGYWLYTNDPFDNEKKREAFERYGFEQGLDILARSNS